MNTINVWICLLFVLVQNSHALRCRSGNPNINNEVEKVMMKCKRQHSQSGKNDSSSYESSEDASLSLNGNIFNQEFFSNPKKELQNNTRNSGSRSSSSSSSKRNNSDSYRQWFAMRTGETQHQMSYGNSNNGFMRNGMQSNQQAMDDNNHQYSCNAQCFFNELNTVNHRGFPERLPVTEMMLRGIHDPNLRDFLEESILECFQFLRSQMNHDKCAFSQHLLNCFADKAQERCEDWSD